MFIVMKRRRGPNGFKRWTEVVEEGYSAEDRETLDILVAQENALDPIFEYAVFEKPE